MPLSGVYVSAESPLSPFCAPAPCPTAAEGAPPGGRYYLWEFELCKTGFVPEGLPELTRETQPGLCRELGQTEGSNLQKK